MSTVNVDAAVASFGPGSSNLANKIQFSYIPEPGALALVALAAVGLIRRR